MQGNDLRIVVFANNVIINKFNIKKYLIMGKVINVQMDEDFYNEIIQGGGSGSGSGETSTIEYLDISNWNSNTSKSNLVVKSNIIKVEKYGSTFCITPAMALGPMANSIGEALELFENATIAVCIDFNLVLKYPDGEFTNKELLLENGVTQEELDAIHRITKEEFYNLDNNNTQE